MSSDCNRPDLDPELLAAQDRSIRNLIRRFVADPHLVEDLAQDTWLSALRHTAAGRFLQRAWLGRVAQNHVFQAMRGAARRLARESAVARSLAIDSPEDAPIEPELKRRLLDALQALDEPYQSTLFLRFFEDLPPTAIAERTGVPVETVRTRIKRALNQLRAGLQARRSVGK